MPRGADIASADNRLEFAVKFVSLLLSFLLVFTYTTSIPVLAVSTNFSTDSSGKGAVSAQVPVNKIGALLLADATAFLSQQSIEVKSNKSTSGDQPLLTGTLFNAKETGGKVKGLVLFTGGSKFSSLCSKGGTERIKTSSGDVIS